MMTHLWAAHCWLRAFERYAEGLQLPRTTDSVGAALLALL